MVELLRTVELVVVVAAGVVFALGLAAAGVTRLRERRSRRRGGNSDAYDDEAS